MHKSQGLDSTSQRQFVQGAAGQLSPRFIPFMICFVFLDQIVRDRAQVSIPFKESSEFLYRKTAASLPLNFAFHFSVFRDAEVCRMLDCFLCSV